MSDQNLDQLRATARQLVERINSDSSFKEKVEKDPKGTLVAEGLPENAVGEFLHEANLTDVAGYSADLTISITACLLSCLISL
ncbi:hypothetical protein [Tengunoibacter tsumagoiensis]|uniref:Nif11 domain-containing protein n=1 Tax=Tengunoibacter tsumagoiensis TaxID=2014871 RepID=A0A402A6C9_9CHLR|nr:hypothetical protein [Tengunoibacter tsumagoiensis]GCE14649.1 hypothetical protein KTT_45080 [Tengunoibacter tsumagoiensis]